MTATSRVKFISPPNGSPPPAGGDATPEQARLGPDPWLKHRSLSAGSTATLHPRAQSQGPFLIHRMTTPDAKKLYRIRFAGDQGGRDSLWKTLCRDFLQRYVAPTDTVLDVAAGWCEFINNI